MELCVEINKRPPPWGKESWLALSAMQARRQGTRVIYTPSLSSAFIRTPRTWGPVSVLEETEAWEKEKGAEEVPMYAKASHSSSGGLPCWLLIYVLDT